MGKEARCDVAFHALDVMELDESGHTGRVDISASERGGWNVTATLDGRVMAIRHCGDWHRVERACIRMESELQSYARPGDATPG
jgi:hypothetical protein